MKTAVARRPRKARASNEALLALLPEQGDCSEELYLALTDNVRLPVELSDGYVEILPMPTVEHQLLLKRLLYLFTAFVEPAGIVLFSPLRLRLWPQKIREPDLLLLKSKNDPRNQNRMWTGADLVLEILSDDDRARDLVQKRVEYARASVPEYWIVDPRDRTITVLVKGKRGYRRHGRFRVGHSADSVILPGFSVTVADLFEKQADAV
jgi:Uma2 family endonuclease